MPTSEDHWLGIHCVCILGYSDKSQTFEFVNSWGEGCGDKGFGYIPYEYVEEESVEICASITINQYINDLISGENEIVEYQSEKHSFYLGVSRGYTLSHPNILFQP